MNVVQTVKFGFTDLSSRARASRIREHALEIINADRHAEFDLSGVESISASFADELFGVLLLELGEERFFEAVRVREANEHVLRSIALAIVRRRSRLSPEAA
ncbi:MAG: STAS-like domain-containing protein [Pseudomonadales bacterium]